MKRTTPRKRVIKSVQNLVSVINHMALGIMSAHLVQSDISMLIQVSNSDPDGESLEKWVPQGFPWQAD